MRKLAKTFGAVVVAAFLATAALTAGAAYARPAADGWIDFHFASPDGKTKVIREPLALDGKGGCMNSSGRIGTARALISQNPDLAGMKFVGASCGVSTASNPAPASLTLKTASVPAPGKAPPGTVIGAPAVIVLRFQSPDGRVRKAVIGDQKPAYYYMGSCPSVLRQKEQTLLAQVRPDFAGLKYLGANCVLFDRSADDIMNSSN